MHTHSTKFSTPHPHDFLFGRGVAIHKHPGNVILRKLVTKSKSNYQGNTRDARKRLSYKIYAEMKGLDPPARFLLRESVESDWIEVDEDKAIMKISQSLSDERRKPPSKKKKKDSIISNKVQNSKDSLALSLPQDQKQSTSLENVSKCINYLLECKSSKSNLIKKKMFKLNHNYNENTNHSVSPDRNISSHGTISEDSSNHFPKENSTHYDLFSSIRHNTASPCNDVFMSHLNVDCESRKKSRLMINSVWSDSIPGGTDTMSNDESSGTKFKTTKCSSKKMNDDLNNIITSISYIGQSFLLNDDTEEETSDILKDLAKLGNNKEYDGLYLPSIVRRLCNRMKELDRKSVV